MGTEIQSKMYFPVYSIPTLTNNVAHGGWSLLNKNKSVMHGKQYDMLSTRPVVNGLHEGSKEQVRQMILKHESVFKHQLNELHLLYRRQKDLMNEFKSKELLEKQKEAAESQLPLLTCDFPSGGSGYHRPSMSTRIVPSQSGVKKLQKRLFNLELPADQYISDGEEPDGVLSGPANGSYPYNRRNEAKVSSYHTNEAFGDSNGALSSGLYLERSPLDKMSVATNDVYRGVWPFTKKFPENPQLGKNSGISSLHLKNESNQLANALTADQTRSSFGGNFGLRDFNKPCEISKIEARKVYEPAKMTLLGIEISDRDLNSSSQASRSDIAAISQSPPNWTKPSSSLSNNRISGEANSVFNTFPYANSASRPFTPGLTAELANQNGAFFRRKSESEQLYSYPPSIIGGFPYAESSHGSASKEFTQPGVQWHYSSLGCKADAKPSINVQDNEFVNRPGNQDSRQGRLHWLEAASLCNGPLLLAVDNSSVKIESAKGDSVHDPTQEMRSEKLKTQNDKAYSLHHIDLNICISEDETQRDVQIPMVVVKDVSIAEASEERICNELPHSSHDGPITIAAETLVAISSSQAREMLESATVMDSSLMWFAEIASSNEQNLGQTENVVKLVGETTADSDVDSSLDSMDSFEYMTLTLAETVLDQSSNVTSNKTKEASLSKRPQRCPTRIGRQNKDSHRVVISGIACLSRNEVTGDLQTFNGSTRASGWQSGISRASAGKVGRGKGRKRLATRTLSTSSTLHVAFSHPQTELQPQNGKLQEPEKGRMTVTGWGKRTRRPPRQRYPIDSSPVSQK